MSKTLNFQTVKLHDYPDHVGVFVLPKDPGAVEKIGRGYVVKRGGLEEFIHRVHAAETKVLKDLKP